MPESMCLLARVIDRVIKRYYSDRDAGREAPQVDLMEVLRALEELRYSATESLIEADELKKARGE